MQPIMLSCSALVKGGQAGVTGCRPSRRSELCSVFAHGVGYHGLITGSVTAKSQSGHRISRCPISASSRYGAQKEALFESVLLRGLLAVWHALIARMRADPSEALLHRFLRAQTLIVRSRPIARALFTRDVALLGKLTQSSVAQ